MRELKDITINNKTLEQILTEHKHRMIYESYQNRAKQNAQLPPKIKELMSTMPMMLGER